MPLWPSFVPLVQEIVAWCVGGQLQQRNLLVGEPLDVSVTAATAERALIVQTPDGRDPARSPCRPGDYHRLELCRHLTERLLHRAVWPSGGSRGDVRRQPRYPGERLDADRSRRLQDEVWPGIPFVYQTSWQQTLALSRPPARAAHSACSTRLGLLFVEPFWAGGGTKDC